MTLKEKLTNVIEEEIQYAEKNGKSCLSTCDHSNWDKDIWSYRDAIIEGIRKRGYNVTSSTKWGVLDITTTLNTITIKKVKDSWSREEVKKLLQLGMNKAKSNFNSGEISKWIEKNL